jgi:hypothetical protein
VIGAVDGRPDMSAREKLGPYVWDMVVNRPDEPIWWGADIPSLKPSDVREIWDARRDAHAKRSKS